MNADESSQSIEETTNFPDELASLVGDLSAEQRELLSLLMEEQELDHDNVTILPQKRSQSEDGIEWRMPLSYAQQRLWFLDQLEPESLLYNLLTIVHLTGQLNIPVLKQCIEEIILRHEILRTTFHEKDGQPFQSIAPAGVFDLPEIDLQKFPESDQLSEVMQLAAQEARKSFDLAKGPLLRVTLIRLGDSRNVVVVNVHHIIADGWSVNVLIFEMASLYEAYSAGKPSPLPPLPVQYADYAAWQRNYLQGPILEKQLDYWLERLTNSQPILSLPTDFSAGAVLGSTDKTAGKSFHFEIPAAIYQKLLYFSQREGVTLFMTLLASFQVLLYRYSGQDDFNVGVPMANRTRAEIETLIGFFVNTLVLRAEISPEQSFRDFLNRVKEHTLEAFANQDLPFEVLVEKLDLDRNTGTSPLFQVVFALQNASRQNKKFPGLTLNVLPLESETAKFDLSLIMVEDAGQLTGAIEYRTNLFTPFTIEQFSKHYVTLLSSIVDIPDEKVCKLQILSNQEFRQITIGWNNSENLFESGCCIHELFEEQVRIHPETPALIFYDGSDSDVQQISYAELDERANILARYLSLQGVGPETLVGVLVNRSIEMIVAILAILKSGGAYLPLDPNYPLERLQFMLEDSEVKYLIAQERPLKNLTNNFPGISIILIDRDWQKIANSWVQMSQSALENRGGQIDPHSTTENPVHPDNLAYIIYTSGSTGRPKGVLLQHRGISNLVTWQKETFGIGRESRILQFSPLSFDASVWEIFMALANGAMLCLTTQDILTDGLLLLKLLAEMEITTVTLPPSILNVLATLPGKELEPVSISALPALSTVIAAGEACTKEIVTRWAPGRHFFNAYGPTETTVCASAALCSEAEHGTPSIGRPISNTHLYILDPHQQVLPIGVPGELYIGGVGVARGYLRRPDLNPTKFCKNPLYEYLSLEGEGEQAEETLYRSGDLVRYRSNGDIEFLGRIDQQVKLRGFRIELGEIEAVIRQYGEDVVGSPFIRDAAVVIHENEMGHKRLVAYMVGEVGYSADLRNYLQSLLPDYMIPSLFIPLESLPIGTSGKVDRKKLSQRPLPDPHRPSQEDWLNQDNLIAANRQVSPRTPEEQIVVDVFCQTLHIPQVSIIDNFFDLGGHSLLATQLVARLRAIFQIDIPLRTVFESPTPASLAEVIRNGRTPFATANDSHNISVIPQLARDPVTRIPLTPPPLSFAQQRLWFLEQFDPGTPNYNIPTVLRISGNLNVQAFEQSLNEIIRRHEVLRTSFVAIHGQAIQIIQPEVSLKIQQEDLRFLTDSSGSDGSGTIQSQAATHSRALAIAAGEVILPFDITKAPLLKVKLIRMTEDEWLVVFSIHHLVSDGWSIGVLIRELAVLYTAILEFELIHLSTASSNDRILNAESAKLLSLPVLPVQYAEFAAWQRNWLQGELLEEQLDYWLKELKDSPPLLNLPTDRPRPQIISMKGGQVGFLIDGVLAGKLAEISREAGATLFMTLLGSLQILLMRLSGQDDICVGTPIAGRVHNDLENLIGFFVNTLVLRTRFDANPNFREVLDQVRDVCLGAYTHQDLPFENLVNEINPLRELGHSPLFQVMFVMQNIPFYNLELPGLAITVEDVDAGISRFDLTFTIANGSNGFNGAVEYRQDLFDQATIERFIELWKGLLTILVTDLDTPVKELEVDGLIVRYGGRIENKNVVEHGYEARGKSQKELPSTIVPPTTPPRTPPRTPEEVQLLEIWKKVLGKKEIGIFDNFFELGGDSILSIQVTALASEAGLQISPRHIFEGQTIAELASIAEHAPAMIIGSSTHEQGTISGELPLTPIQHWFFTLDHSNPSHFNQSMLFTVNHTLEPDLLESTIRSILIYHDALRLRFRKDESGWQQTHAEPGDQIPFDQYDISNLDPQVRKQTIETVSDQVQLSLNIEKGPLLRVVYFNAGVGDSGRLLLVAHHLVVDAISWRIILEDFQSIYTQLLMTRSHGSRIEPRFPLKTSSYQTWARRLMEYAHSQTIENELGYWFNVLETPTQEIVHESELVASVEVASYLLDKPVSFGSIHLVLEKDETRALLQDVSARLSIDIQAILLAAMASAYGDWFDSSASDEVNVLISIESHGRHELWQDVDVSRTVGWFTNFYPVVLNKNRDDDPGIVVKKVKKSLREIPQHGIGYGILRYLRPDYAEQFRSRNQPKLLFNYLGLIDRALYIANDGAQVTPGISSVASMFAPAQESSGMPFDPEMERPFLLEINCAVINDQFVIDWIFNQRKLKPDRVERLAEAYLAALRRLIEFGMDLSQPTDTSGTYSATDFPLAGVDQADLDKVISRISQTKKKNQQ